MSNFEFNGEEYEEASKHQQEWGEKLIQELDLSGKEDILDLGCGDGNCSNLYYVLEEVMSLLTSVGPGICRQLRNIRHLLRDQDLNQ